MNRVRLRMSGMSAGTREIREQNWEGCERGGKGEGEKERCDSCENIRNMRNDAGAGEPWKNRRDE